jgi:hypothetical protein
LGQIKTKYFSRQDWTTRPNHRRFEGFFRSAVDG